ncbi:MAG: hypothetical protein IJT87_02255 [Ruminiclostridium sp.]|nr:hypothetical protein [Ruminiclostridium sp.]
MEPFDRIFVIFAQSSIVLVILTLVAFFAVIVLIGLITTYATRRKKAKTDENTKKAGTGTGDVMLRIGIILFSSIVIFFAAIAVFTIFFV